MEVGIASMVDVHTGGDDKAHSVAYAHSCLAVDKEHFPLVVLVVVGMRYTEDSGHTVDSDFQQRYSVMEHVEGIEHL